MDYWNLKAPSIWDFSEFPCQETVDGSTSASSMPQGEGDFSVDLKLGQVRSGSSVVYEAEGSKKGVSLVVAGPTKRARAVNNNNNNVGHGHGLQASVCCLVDGCYADLSNCREYHRRHKVCELHSKTPEVTIAGHKQRFCQQCSRFHALEEFDEGKRSCRKRLEGHNRRRRKPQPDPPLMLPVNCLSNYQGTRSSPFSNTNHIYSSAAAAAVGNPIWVGVDNNPEAAASAAHYNQQMHCFHNILPSCHPGSSSSSTSTMFGGVGGGVAKSSFSLLHGSQALPSRAISLLETGSSSNHHHHHHNNNNNNSSNMYCEGLSLQVHHDTDHCALSLLSPPPPHMNMMQTPTTTTGLNSGGGGMVQGRTSSSSSSSKHGILMAAAAAADSVQMVSASQCSSRGAIFDDQHSPPTLPFHWD